jgi:uncharacterized protein (TIGR03118 family)
MFILKTFQSLFFGVLAIGIIVISGCKTETTTPTNGAYQVTYLVSDTAAYGSGVHNDPELKNGWGIAVGPTGYFWVSSTEEGVSTVYDASGNNVTGIGPVTIPSRDSLSGGSPTGQVYNSTAVFKGSKFIFAGEDGIISGWTSGDSAKRMYINPSPNAVYKGIAIAQRQGIDYIYVTNFKENKIEVIDGNFNLSTQDFPFLDPEIPAGYAPFGISNIDGKLYVTYAKQQLPDKEDDEKGAGFGYVSIFNSDGTLYKHFASDGTLNAPWAIVKVPSSGFGNDFKDAILIGNFGDGKINAYAADGSFLGQLKDNNGNVIAIDGLWGMVFTGDGKSLYFAAGPFDEEHGLFGKIEFK